MRRAQALHPTTLSSRSEFSDALLARRPLLSYWYPRDMLFAKLRREGQADISFYGPLFCQDRRRWGASIPLPLFGKYNGGYLTCFLGAAGLPWARSGQPTRDALVLALGLLMGSFL